MKSLPIDIQDKISEMPEHSYGVNKVSVVLNDGNVFKEVYVSWGEEILKVGNSKNIPFDPSCVVKVYNET